ncbi:HD-GYP domain-containing protein [Roseibium aggregatum]|uniref:HD domain-containing protein n=1 Tax=Roseibium aggregatum TaxID=187304 RepID=A0A939EI71_9HYPH|nr:HD domain-containing phosphohydrolase [Roseibium aggregatum]MBN9673666.1 HD domain-containing protein [Roseibium aggregatum]
MEIVLISDGPLPIESPVRKLPFFFPARLVDMSKVSSNTVGDARIAIIELLESTDAGLSALRTSWESIAQIPVICLVAKSDRRENIQAAALGRTTVLDRGTPLALMLKTIQELVGGQEETNLPKNLPTETGQAFVKGIAFLEGMWLSAVQGKGIQTAQMEKSASDVFTALSLNGLSPWLQAVNAHHSATYSHSLAVAGLAGAFAKHLGWSDAVCRQVIAGGLIHDIGKARIPLTILDKAERLTAEERAMIDRHPEFGREILKPQLDVPVDIKKMAIQHHEYLDGSGYPDGLKGGRISDKVRVITICDIYVALTEDRAYKPGLSARDAIKTMKDLGAKLDQSLLDEFAAMLLNRQFGQVSRKSSAA